MIYRYVYKLFSASWSERTEVGRKAQPKKALNTTDPRVLSKYSSYLTDQELNDRINRIQIEQRARALIPQKKKKKEKTDFSWCFISGWSGGRVIEQNCASMEWRFRHTH